MLEPGAGGSWPVELTDGEILLRPLGRRDGRSWNAVRSNNAAWLAPWEATRPEGTGRPLTFASMVRGFDREAKAGRMLPLAVEVGGRLCGQVTVSAIVWGSLRSGQIGYWIDRSQAGRGVVPTAVAMMVDHCFFGLGMHRLEVNIRPENVASLRVVEKLGFRPEGIRRRYLHIDGEWRDHATFALTPEDVPGGLLTRWRRAQRVLSARNDPAGGDPGGLPPSGYRGPGMAPPRSRSTPDGPWSQQSPGTPARHTADTAASRSARRQVAVGADTWDPIPVPAPTYTLKPAVFRPEPPPLDLPAARPAAVPAAKVRSATDRRTRDALPRRAEEIERILGLDADPLGLQQRKAVNG